MICDARNHGRRKGRVGGFGTPWILNYLANKGCFLSLEWEKTNFTTFDPIGKNLENPLVAPSWNKSFRRPCPQS